MINVYVDGSYNKNTKYSGWAYLIENNNIIEKNNGKVFDKWGSRNVTGELIAVTEALEKLITLYSIEINIYYDYLGIEMWANGKWKANKTVPFWYKNKINAMKELYNWKINFIKVKSHSGNKYNDIVDKLARKACSV